MTLKYSQPMPNCHNNKTISSLRNLLWLIQDDRDILIFSNANTISPSLKQKLEESYLQIFWTEQRMQREGESSKNISEVLLRKLLSYVWG